jgi:hypothetical protein
LVFLAPGCKLAHEEIAAMIELCYGFEVLRPIASPSEPREMTCPKCGGRMLLETTVLPYEWAQMQKPVYG